MAGNFKLLKLLGMDDIERKIIHASKNILSEREYYTVLYRWQGETLTQVANRFSVTPERVRQIEAKAIRKIKRDFHVILKQIISYLNISTFGLERRLEQERVDVLNTLKTAINNAIQETFCTAISSTQIRDLELSIRASNALLSNNIMELSQFGNVNDPEGGRSWVKKRF